MDYRMPISQARDEVTRWIREAWSIVLTRIFRMIPIAPSVSRITKKVASKVMVFRRYKLLVIGKLLRLEMITTGVVLTTTSAGRLGRLGQVTCNSNLRHRTALKRLSGILRCVCERRRSMRCQCSTGENG